MLRSLSAGINQICTHRGQSALICVPITSFRLWLVLGVGCAVFAQDQPSDLNSLLTQARTLINQGKPSLAVERLQASHQNSNPKVASLLGIAYYHAKDYIRVIEQLAPSVDKLPEGALEQREAIQVLGLSKYLAGRLIDSIPLLEKTRAWAADNNQLACTLGMAYARTHQSAKARKCFARLFRVAPDSAAAHVLTAQVMIRVEIEDLA